MQMAKLTSGYSLLAIVAATLAAGLAEVWLRPAPPFLYTPLLASALALLFAFFVYERDRSAERRHEEDMQRSAALQFSTIEALALAIDARDRASQSQVRREQRHAAALARAFGMPDDEIEGVRIAALLHDIGKLAVPDHILSKPGALTDDERTRMRTHAAAGAGIIASVPFPYPVASLIGSHHERWDGSGYPAGLRGADIPLGARILSVVDYFAAITSDRPFNRAMPVAEAINVLWQEAGNALDPDVVARYVDLLPALREVDDEVRRAAGLAEHQPGAAWQSGATAGRGEPGSLLDDIGVANQELCGLYEIAATMGTSIGVTDSMSVIASKLDRLVSFSTCALFVYDTPNGVARCRFAIGAGQQALINVTVRDGQGLIGTAIVSGLCAIDGDPAVDPATARSGVAEAGLKSALVCPLTIGGAVTGALALYHTTPGYFTDAHRQLVLRIAGQVAAVINNAVLFEQTREDSVTDPLTGLPNTRFLFSHAGRELARAARLNTSVTLLLMDLDNLKAINDSFGHQAGNRAICGVAAVLRGAIRPYDVCVRYGGDEFIVLLSDCGLDQAEAKRLELQGAVEAIPFSVGEMMRVRLAISAGAAVFPVDGDTYDALLQVADSRMYEDKAARKRVKSTRPGAVAT